jgi:hypothetical protein
MKGRSLVQHLPSHCDQEEGRLTSRGHPEGLGAVPDAVAGSAFIGHVVLEGSNGQLALYNHSVEGLLAQHLGV